MVMELTDTKRELSHVSIDPVNMHALGRLCAGTASIGPVPAHCWHITICLTMCQPPPPFIIYDIEPSHFLKQ